MNPLTPEAALEVWERGRASSSTDRALALLGAADPTAGASELSALALGERDRRLLELRAATLGPMMLALASCPHCSTAVEVPLRVEDFLAIQPASGELQLRIRGEVARFRLPTSDDLRAAAAALDASGAEEALLERCLVSAAAAGSPLSASERNAVAQAMSAADPLAEIHLDLACAECGESWQELFEIADFFFEEVAEEARRLLWEVALLAQGYGWREADILAMSPWRRRAYRELLEA